MSNRRGTKTRQVQFEKKGKLRDARGLAQCDLSYETPKHQDWTNWIDTFCPEKLDARSGLDFPNLEMATRAATIGAGFVIVDLVLSREE